MRVLHACAGNLYGGLEALLTTLRRGDRYVMTWQERGGPPVKGTPDASGFLASVEYVTMVVIGGLASVPGAVVGAALLVLMPQVLTMFHDYEHALLGLLIMLFMIFLRVGIVPGLAALFRRRA